MEAKRAFSKHKMLGKITRKKWGFRVFVRYYEIRKWMEKMFLFLLLLLRLLLWSCIGLASLVEAKTQTHTLTRRRKIEWAVWDTNLGNSMENNQENSSLHIRFCFAYCASHSLTHSDRSSRINFTCATLSLSMHAHKYTQQTHLICRAHKQPHTYTQLCYNCD